ncbi:Histidine protein kinase SLN1 [Candida viswanathii]|uniref:histidine kinase n=1 Tax=Candida viswanathii TaxID=5486 RepID=A0A367YKZ1_9ASCO|nr:Histidine protein kinase SLN1 [Candida viswanathii]
MRRLKIGIRPQLIVLVCFASLFSLLILGIVTGVYFSENLRSLRSERLLVISQLKRTQVQQAIQYIAYQAITVAEIDQVTVPLSKYRAGNNSESVFQDAQDSLLQFVISTDAFVAATLYNLDLEVVAGAANNASLLSLSAQDVLFPLRQNSSIPSALDKSTGVYFTGPIANYSTDILSPYFMGITIPVLSNSSIILNEPSISGYLTIVASAESIREALNSTSQEDYQTYAILPVFGDPVDGIDNLLINSQTSGDQIIGFQMVFPVPGFTVQPGNIYNINSSSSLKTALSSNSGTATNLKSYSGKTVAIGYSRITVEDNLNWTIVVMQIQSVFDGPANKLRKIIIGVVIGIGVFMCLITFPLAVWFIRPITKLKEATEAITQYKKEKLNTTNSAQPDGSDQPLLIDNGKRNSVHSSSNASSYSTGIRLPARIPRSKKFFKDELTELSEAFNIMTEELDKQYTHLEDRVKSRTKELEASKIEAESANEAKTVFIANISHELRTPLNGILGMTSIAMEEDDSDRIHDSLKLIHRSGELLLHILTELLTYSKNTLNRSKLEKSNFQILEIVYQVQSIFNKLAHDQRVNFKILIKPNLFRKLILYGDSNRIIQIMMNLVSNSLKFTPVDGSVGVSFKLLGEYDQQRSLEVDFRKVYVLNDPSSTPPPPPPSDEKPHPPKPKTLAHSTAPLPPLPGSKLQPQPDNRKKDYFSSRKITNIEEEPDDLEKDVDKYLSSSNDDDTMSIVTLSTSQYETKIFESQFKAKPLPQVPVDASPTASLSDQGLKSSDEEQGLKSSDDDTVHEKQVVNSSSSNDSTTVAVARPRYNMMPQAKDFKSFPTFDKKPVYDSNMSNNEVVKNNKAYRIRNMYQPKVWVIQMEVTDTGPGIEPAMQDKVFEPFVQGDQTLSRSYGGTGLGLSICRQLATMMKGTLTLKSTIGKGSTFTLTLPLPQTGEIMVPPEDMPSFCEDEFNPAARINRKVAFDDEPVEVGDEKTSSESADPRSDSESFLHPHTSLSDSPNVDSDSSDNKHEGGNVDTPPKLKRRETSSSSSASSSEANKHRLDLDKPLLYTRGSTGTANSKAQSIPSSSSDKKEGSSNDHTVLDDLSHLKILVAEDNMVNQEVIKRMLKLEGLTNLKMACNGAEAIDSVKESMEAGEPYDLVFMDVQMPKVDGLIATKTIRNNLHYNKPIIALTAFADESNVKECLAVGMSGFLAKPIRRTNLRKIIVEFLLSEIPAP